MKRFRYPAIFTTVFPINTYYDVARILSLFLKYETKNHKKCLILKEYPNELISLNLHAKIYRKMKEFVTVYIMNIYDVSVVEEIIECYISDFSYFFKTVNNNEYI